MSKSIHITIKNFRGLTKNELNEQVLDPNSEMAEWSKKRSIKSEIKKRRRLINKKPNG